MKKAYQAPAVTEVGGVATLTAAFGTSSRMDFSEFPQVTASNGSFDVCDPSRANSDPDSNCAIGD